MATFMGVVGFVSNTLSEMECEWRIYDYFSRRTNANEYFASPPFTFSGCSWDIHVFPRGKNSNGWISVFLNRNDSGHKPMNILYSLSAKLARETDILENKMGSNIFTNNHRNWGWKEFMKLKSEDSSQSLIFRCHVKLLTSLEVSKLPREMIEMKNLSRDFKDLLLNGSDNCDIIINVKGVIFRAHRTILIARCPELAAAQDTDMLENHTGVINIEDCDSDSFYDFLLYLYTGSIEYFSLKNVCHLFTTAHKYNVKGLVSLCARFLTSRITLYDFYDVAMLAEKFEETELLRSVQIFFNQHFSKVIEEPAWESLLKSNHLLVTKLLRGVTSEDEVSYSNQPILGHS